MGTELKNCRCAWTQTQSWPYYLSF